MQETEDILTPDEILFTCIDIIRKHSNSMKLERDVILELGREGEKMLVERFWLASKIQQLESTEETDLTGEHLRKADDAVFLVEGDDSVGPEEEEEEEDENDIMLKNDAEEDDAKIRRRLLVKEVAEIQRKKAENSLRRKHRKTVISGINETKKRLMDKEVIQGRIEKLNAIYSERVHVCPRTQNQL
jgi:hypothetical protein